MDELEILAAKLRSLPHDDPEREAYLEKLRQLVHSGEYTVDSAELARELLEKATDSNS